MRCLGMWVTRKMQALALVLLCLVVYLSLLLSQGTGRVNQERGITRTDMAGKRLQLHGAVPQARVTSSERLLRQTKLAKACAKDKRRTLAQFSLLEKQILYKHIIVNDEHRFLYCYLPKVASANWKRVLMVVDGQAADVDHIPKVERKRLTFLADFPPVAAERKLKTYFKFMFVREPLERLVSAYKNKFVLNNTYFHQRYGQQIVKAHRKHAGKHPKGNDVSLDEFFQHLSSTKSEEMNEHWMPFYKLCQPCTVSYDFVGSFENLLQDARDVLQRVGVDAKVSFPEQQDFYKRVDHSDFHSKLKAVRPKILKKALKKYLRDYYLFSYPVPKV